MIKAVYGHCENVYKAMLKESHTITHGGETAVVYEGFLTRLFNDLGLSMPHYSSVMTELKRMGCVEQIKRGGGGGKSQWRMLHAPTVEEFENAPVTTSLRAQKLQADLYQRVRDIEKRLEDLETAVFVDVDNPVESLLDDAG